MVYSQECVTAVQLRILTLTCIDQNKDCTQFPNYRLMHAHRQNPSGRLLYHLLHVENESKRVLCHATNQLRHAVSTEILHAVKWVVLRSQPLFRFLLMNTGHISNYVAVVYNCQLLKGYVSSGTITKCGVKSGDAHFFSIARTCGSSIGDVDNWSFNWWWYIALKSRASVGNQG